MELFYILCAVVVAMLATAALCLPSKTAWIWLDAVAGFLLAVSFGVWAALKKVKDKFGI